MPPEHSAQPRNHDLERFTDPTPPGPRSHARTSARPAHAVPVLAAITVDLVVVALVTSAAALGRARLPIFTEASDLDALFALVGVPIVLGWVLTIAAHGGYAEHVMGAGTTEYKRVLRATLVAAGAVGIISFLARFQFSRGFFFLLIIIGMPSLLIGRYLLRQVIHRLRARGHLQHRVLVAGSAAHVDEVAGVLARERWLGHDVVGAVLPAAEMAPLTPGGVPVLGTTARVAAIVADSSCDIVLFAGGAVGTAQQMRRIAWDLDDSDVQIMLVPSLTDVASDRMRVRPAAGLHLMELEGPRAKHAASISKRLFDIIGACVLILLASPVLVATAIAIRARDRGPVLFRQQRVGAARRPVRLLQVPVDGRWRRHDGPHRRRAEQARRRPRPVQGGERPQDHRAGPVHPEVLRRRDAPVLQRAAR